MKVKCHQNICYVGFGRVFCINIINLNCKDENVGGKLKPVKQGIPSAKGKGLDSYNFVTRMDTSSVHASFVLWWFPPHPAPPSYYCMLGIQNEGICCVIIMIATFTTILNSSSWEWLWCQWWWASPQQRSFLRQASLSPHFSMLCWVWWPWGWWWRWQWSNSSQRTTMVKLPL